MASSLRRTLADSHIAAVAIAVFVLWALDLVFQALRDPVLWALDFVVRLVAIRGIPYSSPGFNLARHLELIVITEMLFSAVIDLAAAWILARSVYGMGPLQCLNAYWIKLRGRTDASAT